MPLTAYYFMGQDLCIVRRHVREDMEWLADAGTDNIAIGIHEFQLEDQQGGGATDIIFSEAERAGVKVHAIASRWAGLVAGWPTAAGMFAATHPEAWMRKADGSPVIATFCGGAVCSPYHPATLECFKRNIDRMLKRWPFAGIIWDEIKCLEEEDHSEAAINALGEPSRGQAHVSGLAEFFGKVSRHARQCKPDIVISFFIYAWFSDMIMRGCAEIDQLDFFGIDGICLPDHPKSVFGNYERAAAVCSAARRKTLCLVETMPRVGLNKTIDYVTEFLRQPIDHLLFYYYGNNVGPMEAYMNAMKNVVKEWRSGSR